MDLILIKSRYCASYADIIIKSSYRNDSFISFNIDFDFGVFTVDTIIRGLNISLFV